MEINSLVLLKIVIRRTRRNNASLFVSVRPKAHTDVENLYYLFFLMLPLPSFEYGVCVFSSILSNK